MLEVGPDGPVAGLQENDMSKSVKSEQLRAQLEGLDSSLGASSSPGDATPAPRKINEGSDRYGGYPPA